jgi:hypothetical protein
MAGFSKKELKEPLENLKLIAKLQKEIGDSLTGYLDGIKQLGQVQQQFNHLLAQEAKLTQLIADARAEIAAGATGARLAELNDEIDAHRALRKIYRARAAATNEHLQILRATVEQTSLLNAAYKDMGKAWDKLPGAAKKFYEFLKSSDTLEMSKEIKQAELSMGVLSNQSKFFSKTMSNASKSTIQLGFGVKDIAKSQAEYSESIGRNMILSEGGYQAMAEIAKGTTLGAEGAAAMAVSMENFGISVEGSRNMVQETLDAAQRMGANSSKSVKELINALKLGQKYHFKGGVKGMASMAAYAAKMGIDMADVANMAEKAFRPEEAVEMAAKMATLGGSFARLGDPFTLMFKARNDIEGFTKDIGNAASEFAQFNSATGEFDITGLQLDRMRELSKVTGMGVDELSQLAKTSAKFKRIETLIPSVISDEDKEVIGSLANFDKESGQWSVTMNGETKYLKDLEQADLEKYKREQQSLKDRAIQAQTFDDAFNNLIEQFQTMALPFIEGLNEYLVGPLKDLQQRMKDEGWIDSIKAFATTMSKIVGTIGKFIVEFPIVTAAIAAIGTIIFNGLSWYANGVALAKGFNTMSALNTPAATAAAQAARTGPGFMGNLKGYAKGGAAKGGGALAGILSGGMEYSEQKDKGKSTGEALGRGALKGAGAGLGALGGAAAGGAAGAMLAPMTGGLSIPIGMLIGGGIGAFGGGMLTDLDTYGVDDAVIKFNPQDKFMKMDDGLVASTDKGKIDDLVGGGKGGKTKVEFGELKISGEITLKNNNGSTVEVDILRDPFFIKEMTKLIQQQLSMNIGGGKLNPNPA